MCGIAGFTGPPDGQLLKSYLAKMTQRGPDSEGVYQDHMASLGARMLRVMDHTTGDQPIHNETGDLWLVLNGEVYNHRQLRERLEHRGHEFYTESDTETIVHLYEEKGEALVNDLRGFFAFALYDSKNKKLILARDKVGKAPLYYYAKSDGRETSLRFASSLRALISADFAVTLNRAAVAHYLTYLYNPLEDSMVEGVRRLLPGHTLTLDIRSGQLTKRRYWELDLSVVDHSMSEEAALSLAEDSLDEAVRLRLSAKVPVGAFLSGGVDSSAVCASLSRMGVRVNTFALGFESSRSEAGYAALVASSLGLDHREFFLSPDVLGSLPEVVSSLDEPVGSPSIVPTWFLSKKARGHVGVALTGDGGDEVFFGDTWFEDRLDRYFALPGPVRTAVRAYHALTGNRDAGNLVWYEQNRYGSLPFEQRTFLRFAHQTQDEVSTALGAPCPDTWKAFSDVLNAPPVLPLQRRVARVGIEQELVNYTLAKDDQMSMANGLELRSPMLDSTFMERLVRVPDTYKRGKRLLKRVAVERFHLPKSAVYRKKGGFTLPLGDWSKELYETVRVPGAAQQNGRDHRSVARYFGLAVFHLWKQSVLG